VVSSGVIYWEVLHSSRMGDEAEEGKKVDEAETRGGGRPFF